MKNGTVNTFIVIGAVIAAFGWCLLWATISEGMGIDNTVKSLIGFVWGVVGGIVLAKSALALWRSDY